MEASEVCVNAASISIIDGLLTTGCKHNDRKEMDGFSAYVVNYLR